MLQKLFNPKWQLTSKSFLLSSFLVGFSFSPTAKIYRLELEFEESLLWKTSSIFKERIGQESNGAANQEKQIFLLCQISPSASSTRDLGMRLCLVISLKGLPETFLFLLNKGVYLSIHFSRNTLNMFLAAI